MFVIYHDYQHHAILQKSKLATFIMKAYGIFLLTPQNVWKRSHDHHHNHNSKLSISGIGSYPTISKKYFLSLSKNQKRLYLINRHPLTVIFGYFTLFIYWLNVKSFSQSPKKHLDSLAAILFHVVAGIAIWYFLGATTFIISWFMPFFVAFAIGSYLFYSQHNFPGAQFRENHDWKYEQAALTSTSYMVMPRPLQWITGNIGFHHVHHLNSRIPFYRLPEAMKNMPELQTVLTTSWNPIDMWRCFRLKLWDAEQGKMITLKQL
jgi:omega-6 fatty acid desaturase (delta-12 desaturase)